MAKQQLLVVSQISEDHELGKSIAEFIGFDLNIATKKEDIKRLLVSYSHTVVFWDTENELMQDEAGVIIPKYVQPWQIFSITAHELGEYPNLFKYPIFGHHVVRSFPEGSDFLYSKITQQTLQKDAPLGILNFFPEGTESQTIQIKRTTHIPAAVQAVENYLKKQDVNSRLASFVAIGVDELLMNAMYIAPGQHTRGHPRSKNSHGQDIELNGQDAVDLTFSACEEYMAISIGDQFGALKRKPILDGMAKHFHEHREGGAAAAVKNANLGLIKTLRTGVSILCVTEPRKRTEVSLFFPKVKSFQDFKKSFRFFGTITKS